MESQGSIAAPSNATDKLGSKVEDDQARRDAAKRRAAVDAPSKASELTMGRHARIVDHLFDVDDPMEVYERIRMGLTFGSRASSLGHGELVDALDDAQKLAFEAHQLAANMKSALDAFNLDAEVIRGALRKQALAALQDEKDAGKRAKAITNDDITAYMASMFNDEFRDLEMRTGRARRAADVITNLADRAHERARDLRAMVSAARASS